MRRGPWLKRHRHLPYPDCLRHLHAHKHATSSWWSHSALKKITSPLSWGPLSHNACQCLWWACYNAADDDDDDGEDDDDDNDDSPNLIQSAPPPSWYATCRGLGCVLSKCHPDWCVCAVLWIYGGSKEAELLHPVLTGTVTVLALLFSPRPPPRISDQTGSGARWHKLQMKVCCDVVT